MTRLMMWAPAAMFGVGALFTVGIDTQRVMPLRESLDTTVPAVMQGRVSRDVEVPEEEQRVAGMSSYLLRYYNMPQAANAPGYDYSVYVGYYESQRQGTSIHSPKNCLPGAGWEALQNGTHSIQTPSGRVTVNRYLLKRGAQSALVLYWYQGRGRIEANEYRVKYDLLKDSVLRQRSDEALVRIVVPVQTTEADALEIATRVAAEVAPAVDRALPQ